MAADSKLVLLGPPGSGKGTQAEILARELGVPHVSTGNMLRDAVGEGTALGRKVEAIMNAGALVDDATMAEVVRGRLGRSDTLDGFILDGYPRNLAQAETLEAILGASDRDLDAVVLLEVPEEELVARIAGRGRADDGDEVVRERLRVYREKTEPLVKYYDELGALRPVDGVGSVEDVSARILEAIA